MDIELKKSILRAARLRLKAQSEAREAEDRALLAQRVQRWDGLVQQAQKIQAGQQVQGKRAANPS